MGDGNVTMGKEICQNCGKGLYTASTAAVQCEKCEGWIHRTHLDTKEDGSFLQICMKCNVNNNIEVMSSRAPAQDHVLTAISLAELIERMENQAKRIETLERKVAEMKNTIDSLQKTTNEDSFSKNTINIEPGDLLVMAETKSIAHCVAQDMHMGDGIAKLIKNKFNPNIEELKSKSIIGEVIEQSNGNNFILHMVTKKNSKLDKPTSKVLKRTIYNLAKKCEELGITGLYIPKIGSGLDNQPWEKTMKTLKAAFEDSETQVTVIYLRDNEERKYRAQIRNKKLKLTIPKTVPKIEIQGDSHTRGMGLMLKKMNPTKETLVIVKPGATTKSLCNRLNANTSHLTPEDVLFFMSGTNDLKKSNDLITTDYHEREREHQLSQGKHTNLCLISVPHRYDDETFNANINSYNVWLQDRCVQKNIKFIDINEFMDREDYANDGLHFKEEGKLKIVQHLSQVANNIIQQRSFH